MITLMLYHPGMKSLGDTLDQLAIEAQSLVADMGGAFDPAAQPWHRQTAFPAALPLVGQNFDFGVHKDCQGGRMVEHFLLAEARFGPAGGRLKDHQADEFMNLGRCQTCTIGVDHGFDHVFYQSVQLRIGQVGDRFSLFAKCRMAHSCDFSDRHGQDMSRAAAPGKGGQRRIRLVTTRPLEGFVSTTELYSLLIEFDPEVSLQIVVRDNNVDQALKALKKKMQREGLFREMKLRNHFEKPSEKRAREKAEAIRRARKLHRKKLQREGLLPKTPKVVRPGRP